MAGILENEDGNFKYYPVFRSFFNLYVLYSVSIGSVMDYWIRIQLCSCRNKNGRKRNDGARNGLFAKEEQEEMYSFIL